MIEPTNNNNIDCLLSDILYAPGLEGAPVVTIDQFLPEQERNAVFDAICASHKQFKATSYSGKPSSFFLSLESEKLTADPLIKHLHERLSKRIKDQLPALFSALNISPFPVETLSLTIINGLNGHCGLPHSDESGGQYSISLLYYFHKVPKAFCGGDLEFYDTDPSTAHGHAASPYGKIKYTDNLLIAFPSHIFHGITTVQCDRGDFEDGRFVAVVFLGRW